MWRALLAVIVGTFAAGIGVSIGHAIGHKLFPLPPEIDTKDIESLKANWDKIPTPAIVAVAGAWALGAVFGGTVAALITRRHAVRVALVVGLIMTLTTLSMLIMLPHPIWMWFIGLSEWFLITGAIGSALQSKPPAASRV